MNADRATRVAGFRYGVAFLLTFALLVFEIAASEAPWTRAVAVGLQALALTVVVGTSRAQAEVRRVRALVVAGVGIAVAILIGTDVIPKDVAAALGGVLAAAVPAALAGGVLRLIRTQGITLRAVLGALTIYLSVGLLFAWVIAVVAALDDKPYFVQPDVSQGDRVYFSFTVLTTTGFGDFTAATPVGHALAVVEMLVGQLYLVTVIGLLVGGFAGGRGARS